MEPTVTISLNVLYLISLCLVCIISLLIAIYYDQRQLRKQKPEPTISPYRTVVSKSGRVLVPKTKMPVVYNDDEKLWRREQDEKARKDD